MATARNFSMSGIYSGHHNLPTYEMSTGRNFSMLGINSGHHNLPTYQMALKSDNVEFVRYYGGHFENGER
jgi:5-carboxymethyl-2-hydroxymuconate isomerase